jgi:predicted DCC family thiol-disulfide oxidoreductase YuxK
MARDPVIVIYDGQCRLCRASVNWLQMRCEVEAISFHTIDPSRYNLTLSECESQVIAISEAKIFKGAGAVALLMAHRGNRTTAAFIRASGPIGRATYRWVSTHRNSVPVKALTRIIEKLGPPA